jgi:nucleoside-diphosphate-sugar epimerase
MRVIVTGAAGFIGSTVVRALLARGDEVVAVDLHPPAMAGTRFVRADLRQDGPWQDAFRDVDLVVHTAALVEEAGDRDRFVAVNVEGTRRVCAAAARHGVGRVVHVSSIVVYGDRFPVGSRRREDDPLVPTGRPYTDTKIAADLLVRALGRARGLDVTVVRLGDVYGPGSRPWVERPLALLRRGLFVHVDGGRWPLSPVHVDDAVHGILLAADAVVARGRTYNLAGPPVPARDFFEHHARHLGVRVPSVPAPVVRTAAGALQVVARLLGREAPLGPEAVEYVTHPAGYDSSRAERELGWRATIGLSEGLARTFAAAGPIAHGPIARGPIARRPFASGPIARRPIVRRPFARERPRLAG